MEDAVEFTKRWISIGADDVEHTEHDGSAPPDQVHCYYCIILDQIPNPDLHVGHFHVTTGCGLANVLAAMQAGIDIIEGSIGGIGGQPANFVNHVPGLKCQLSSGLHRVDLNLFRGSLTGF